MALDNIFNDQVYQQQYNYDEIAVIAECLDRVEGLYDRVNNDDIPRFK